MKKDDIMLLDQRKRSKMVVCKLIFQHAHSRAWLVKNIRGYCVIVSNVFLHPCKEPWQLTAGAKIETVGLGESVSSLSQLFKRLPLTTANRQRLFGDFLMLYLKERNEELERNRCGSGTSGSGSEAATAETTNSGQAAAGVQSGPRKQNSPEPIRTSSCRAMMLDDLFPETE